MNTSETLEIFTFLSGLISLIVLIVFFVVASNIGSIKRTLAEMANRNEENNYSKAFGIGELKEYQGKKQEALDYYVEALFRLSKLKQKGQLEEKNKQTITAKIVSLGGTVKEL